ncbi:PapD-like protein [Umbelopsis sp. PMI_123]|nr:PapD-like protein [Umbelopsis sp. PMI_123]
MTSKHSPVIRISPPEFQFYPSRQGSGYTARLHVKNLIESSVAFKFKTNAPTRYSVKPVLAVLHPGDAIETYVRSETPVSDQDKFLIQSVPLTEEESDLEMTAAEWKALDKRRITDNFINCVLMRGLRPRVQSIESRSSSPPMSPRLSPIPPSPSSPQYNRSVHQQDKSEQQPFPTFKIVIFSIICILIGLLIPFEKFALLFPSN